MKLFDWRWFAVSSLLLTALTADAATRPQYGRTLHVTMHAAPVSLDPADRSLPDSLGRRGLTGLIFDTLVILNNASSVQPALAETWQAQGNQQWQFRLRPNVTFDDGSPLTAEIAAASLRFANPSWTVRAAGDGVTIVRDASAGELLAELALPRNAIVKRGTDGKLNGTGAFRIVNWQPGKRLTLAAAENCWRGRPFLDGVEIEMGKSFRDQMAALQTGKADLIEVAPEEVHRTPQDGGRLKTSKAIDLLALVFSRDASSPEERILREALGWSIEKVSIRDVLLQGAGEPAGSILPTWMSGYGFVFPSASDLAKARQLRTQIRTVPTWKLGYDTLDPLDRLLAERIALNAKDAELSIQPTPASGGDLRLVRISLASPDPGIAFGEFVDQIGLSTPKPELVSEENIYKSEQAAIAAFRVIPLFHLPASYASSVTLRNWRLLGDGSWDIDDAWLETTKP
jgi:MarR-like DNA-binding transcriptional regulator SgrR of sgrS sRNA